MPKNAPGIPAGDYATSCAGCSLAADVLTCSHCEKPCGARVHSRIETTSCPDGAGITNRAGVLACKEVAGATNADGVPEGNYLDSCQGCAVTETAGKALSGMIQLGGTAA